MFQFTQSGPETHWTVPVDLPSLAGHFPQRPVLPAVSVLDATVHALRAFHRETGELAAIVSAKFTAVIEPGRSVRIQISAPADREWLAIWLDRDRDEKLAEVRLRFR